MIEKSVCSMDEVPIFYGIYLLNEWVTSEKRTHSALPIELRDNLSNSYPGGVRTHNLSSNNRSNSFLRHHSIF